MTTYELYTENQITGTQEQMDSLTAQQEVAYGDGDFKTVAEINKRLFNTDTSFYVIWVAAFGVAFLLLSGNS